MTRAVRVAALATLVALGWPASASADCTITATSVVFGSYNVFNATPRDSTGTVSVRCIPTASVTVTLSRGSSSTYTTRTLRSGTFVLNYNLYQNAARTTIFGDGTGGTGRFSGSVGLTTRNITVYGRIPAGQDARVGSYTDTIIATITF